MIAEDLCKAPEKFWETETYRVTVANPQGLQLFSVEMFSMSAPALSQKVINTRP
jgi:hypothetical protein